MFARYRAARDGGLNPLSGSGGDMGVRRLFFFSLFLAIVSFTLQLKS